MLCMKRNKEIKFILEIATMGNIFPFLVCTNIIHS